MACGLPPTLFWDVSPREMALMIDGANRRDRAMQGLAYSHAALVMRAFHDPKRFPDFDKVFPDPGKAKPSAQDPDAILSLMQAWSQRLGARLN